ncbi:MAG TPA: DUF2786 domain-containing protein [Minicystis sp.]|nr:DUF2786 domain-containing protein [Minicystis sp.]
MQTTFSFHEDAPEPAAVPDEAAADVDTDEEPARPDAEPREPPAARLSVELEAALLRELRTTFDELNATFFRRKLVPPAFALSDADGRLGLWIAEQRTVEIARRLVLERPWGVVVEVLKHEMAHQWVHEGLGILTETAHGPAFRETCARLGIDASASGVPDPPPGGAEARVLERVARLLALAESPNEHEAQAAMTAAQRLMLKYNLEQAAAARPRGYGYRHLGRPTGRVLEPERVLAAILGKHFFVEVIWVPVYVPREGRRATVLEVCGTQENLAMAEYVHGFLMHVSEQLFEAHARADRRVRRRDRTSFRAGVMLGFLEKLDKQRAAHKAEGLVWVKDGDLSGYLRRRHPHITTVRRGGSERNEAHQRGREAGRNIVLHKPVDGGGGGGGGGKLLPPKR